MDTTLEDDTGPGGYAWEKGFERSWEMVEEDDEGRIKTIEGDNDQYRRRHRVDNQIPPSVKRSIIRYLYLAVDLSEAMSDTDFRPNRMATALGLVEQFVKEYFDQNPLSQLGLLVTREGICQRVSELSGSPQAHLDALKKMAHTRGLASMQNTLEMAGASLKATPEYGSREVVIIYGSLSTCDPGDIHMTIEKLKRAKIRISVIGLSAEVYICRKAATETNGDYAVATDKHHLSDLLLAQVTPPPTLQARGPLFADLVMMGFPNRVFSGNPSMGFTGQQGVLSTAGYSCPRCLTRTTDLPSTCNICGLPLVSSPHIARSYHHLFPVPKYKPVDIAPEGSSCSACMKQIQKLSAVTSMFACPECANVYCQDCDIYIHDALHNCPGCC